MPTAARQQVGKSQIVIFLLRDGDMGESWALATTYKLVSTLSEVDNLDQPIMRYCSHGARIKPWAAPASFPVIELID